MVQVCPPDDVVALGLPHRQDRLPPVVLTTEDDEVEFVTGIMGRVRQHAGTDLIARDPPDLTCSCEVLESAQCLARARGQHVSEK